MEQLADVLDDLHSPVRLVLDDVHELTEPETLRDLGRLIHRRPVCLQLVLVSRADPPDLGPPTQAGGPAARDPGRRPALHFRRHRRTAPRPAVSRSRPTQAGVLLARTEGWAAGLRLAVLALRRSEDATAFLTNFSGDERSVAEYLTSEILDGLDPDTQDFLRKVSVCTPLPAALAAELSGQAAADWMLDELRRSTALVERTSRGRLPHPPPPAHVPGRRPRRATSPRPTGHCTRSPACGGTRGTSPCMRCAMPSAPATAR